MAGPPVRVDGTGLVIKLVPKSKKKLPKRWSKAFRLK
jgi:hypothetical protein